jgi:hypothetical protein
MCGGWKRPAIDFSPVPPLIQMIDVVSPGVWPMQVVVSLDKNDNRARRLLLSSAGRETLAAANPIWSAEHAALEVELSKANADTLRALLPTIEVAGKGVSDV